MNTFAKHVLSWYDTHGRKSLAWKSQEIPVLHRPYHIWLSEVMLQQTQVTTVIPYYQKFISKFPTLESLADSNQDEVLALWSGLGYYARGRNLHKAAQLMWESHQAIPNNFDALLSMPGIGRSTAGAIMAQAFHKPFAILDGNVKRVLARYYAVEGWYGQSAVGKELWAYSESITPQERIADYTQAIMDLGALLCTRSKPQCGQCPLSSKCIAYKTQQVEKFPYSKPKKVKPVKQAYLLCVVNEDRVLLEQRPPSGIWGGLWSFPEFDNNEDLLDFLKTEYQKNTSEIHRLESFRHTFSHYHLDIHPHILRVSDKILSLNKRFNVQDSSSRFFSITAEPDVGIATPVKRLLNDLSQFEYV